MVKLKFKLFLSSAIGITFVVFLLKDLSIDIIDKTFEGFQLFFLLSVFPIILVNIFLRAIRWALLLPGSKSFKTIKVFYAVSIGMFLNNVLPARIGDFLRVYFIKGDSQRVSRGRARWRQNHS